MNDVSILDQGANHDRKIVGFWTVLKVEPTGFSSELDVRHTESVDSESEFWA